MKCFRSRAAAVFSFGIGALAAACGGGDGTSSVQSDAGDESSAPNDGALVDGTGRGDGAASNDAEAGPSAPAVLIVAAGSGVCAITASTGALRCWGARRPTPSPRNVGTAYVDVAISDAVGCG